MTVYVGIDGGGTHLRVAVTDAALNVLGDAEGGAVNPSSVGRGTAATRIQATIREALLNADVKPKDVTAVAAGIAGASADIAADWVRATVGKELPASNVIASSDMEIALVGAVGERHGIIIIAGTGSAAFGIAPDGRTLRQGGFGYLLGDEGSGYWLGREALAHALREMDGRATVSGITPRVLEAVGASQPLDIVGWLYGPDKPRVADVAALAPLVIELSEKDDLVAQGYVARAASELAQLARTIRDRLELRDAPIAFAGGLLEYDSRLVDVLMRRLHLTERPRALYSPVIGAALLAKVSSET